MQSPAGFLFIVFLVYSSSSTKLTWGISELSVLMEIKASLDPENKYLSSWKTDGDPCASTFEGVACNEQLKVANISLQGKGLTGKLPTVVAELKSLTGLYLHYNALSGEIPKEIADLTELTDLYLDVNNLTGTIPPEIGSMPNLQVLQLCCNNLSGTIPPTLGFMNKLTVLALERNQLTGDIPASLANSGTLNRIYLSFNHLTGPIPPQLAIAPSLEVFDVQTNNLSGVVPTGFLRMKEGLHIGNNSGLCGSGFPSLRVCSVWDVGTLDPFVASFPADPSSIIIPKPVNFSNEPPLKSPRRFPKTGIVIVSLVCAAIAVSSVIFISVFLLQHSKPKGMDNNTDASEVSLSQKPAKQISKRCTPLADSSWEGSHLGYKFNLDEVESATQHFSERNLLGKSKFTAVYKGVLRDGSIVAIKSVNKMSCKTVEDGFIKGLELMKSISNENLVSLKGFCCSKDRGECFLIYKFAPKGSLCKYLGDHKISKLPDWPTRISIIKGIAKGIEYLHRDEPGKPRLIHKNISAEKVVLDENWKPLILDSGLLNLLADDVVYSAMKASAALGYMSPEYVTTGRFTEKTDVYAFGIIVLQILSGRKIISMSARTAAEAGEWEEVIGPNQEEGFLPSEAARLVKIGLDCTNQFPENRPSMAAVVRDLNAMIAGNGDNLISL